MAAKKLSDGEFVELFRKLGPKAMARRTGISERAIFKRRETLEVTMQSRMVPANPEKSRRLAHVVEGPHRLLVECRDGTVLIGSDAHYWPGQPSIAHRAFVHFIEKFQPKAVILNGDVFDGASVSRHPSIGWESKPSVIQEIEACTERTEEIRKAAKNAKLIWTLGNHDARFETRLANAAPEYAKVHGVHLKDHFPYWHPCWSAWINGDVVVKHRLKGGRFAPANNTLYSGKHMATGHLHSLKVIPHTDYNGTRYGIDCGTLSDGPQSPQFVNYLEDAPADWRPGFVILTFKDGCLMPPEVVPVSEKWADAVEFRGEVIHV